MFSTYGSGRRTRTFTSRVQSPLTLPICLPQNMVRREGFEPPCSMRADLQSAAFDQLRYRRMVGKARLELARYYYQGSLSPLQLPITSYPQFWFERFSFRFF